jgi:hypothetical protein
MEHTPHTRKQMIWTIIDAVQNHRFTSRELECDDAILSYYTLNDKGEWKLNEDEFDYVESANPYYVWLVTGTGYENVSVPLAWLTDESLLKLYRIFV